MGGDEQGEAHGMKALFIERRNYPYIIIS